MRAIPPLVAIILLAVPCGNPDSPDKQVSVTPVR